MDNPTSLRDPHFIETLAAHEREQRIRTNKVASLLVAALMPAGVTLDWFVYRHQGFVVPFLILRLISSVLAVGIWFLLTTPQGQKHHRPIAISIALLPAFFICVMIYMTHQGPGSSYYAGLNLIVLAVSVVVRWNVTETIIAVFGVLLMYLVTCLLTGTREDVTIIFNNYYFLIVTGIIVVVGNHFFTRLRLREFAARFELDKSRKELEATNQNLEGFNARLAQQNVALDKANREIKEAEAQLVQSEKMASLGRFSAGLMHDILNPLNYAKTGLYTLQKKSRRLPPELRTDFDQILPDIKHGVDRVQEIVQSLRNFTHPGEQAAEPLELAAMLNDVRRFVAGGLKGKNISLELNLPPQQIVWIGRNDFSVMLINLLENSIDALNGKPFAPEEQPTITVSSHSEGDRTLISIRDNGSGIDPKIIAKIFDPFFTTKDVGKGTGLGLSLCFGMIRSYGGTIAVVSEPGKFSQFTLNLPASAEAAAQTKLPHAEPIRL
jgi:two-component system sensor histidine kinase PhcS